MIHIDELYALYTKHPSIITDSRKANSNSIFFALKGDNFDGNQFAQQALESGCDYAVVDNPNVVSGDRYLLTNDVLSTLQQLAKKHRKTVNIPVIAITGSNGKTTTKELIKSVLSTRYVVHATSGNLNNHIGVPLTLLSMPTSTEIAIIEMGASHPGEIEELCQIALPSHGLITNIGKAHIEGFGSLDGVMRAKKELYDFLDEHKGTIFYKENNQMLQGMLSGNKARLIGFGKASCRGTVIPSSSYLLVDIHIDGQSFLVQTHLAGTYNLENLLAAACVGTYFKIAPSWIAAALSKYEPQNNRSQILETKNNQLLLDLYNANPSSMNESLQNLFALNHPSKMVILGDMFELGDSSSQEHRAVINALSKHPEVNAILVGEQFYKEKPENSRIIFFPTVAKLKKWLSQNPLSGYFILIKGSRKMQLEQIPDCL